MLTMALWDSYCYSHYRDEETKEKRLTQGHSLRSAAKFQSPWFGLEPKLVPLYCSSPQSLQTFVPPSTFSLTEFLFYFLFVSPKSFVSLLSFPRDIFPLDLTKLFDENSNVNKCKLARWVCNQTETWSMAFPWHDFCLFLLSSLNSFLKSL